MQDIANLLNQGIFLSSWTFNGPTVLWDAFWGKPF